MLPKHWWSTLPQPLLQSAMQPALLYAATAAAYDLVKEPWASTTGIVQPHSLVVLCPHVPEQDRICERARSICVLSPSQSNDVPSELAPSAPDEPESDTPPELVPPGGPTVQSYVHAAAVTNGSANRSLLIAPRV